MLEFGLHPWIRSEEDLTCVIKSAAPFFMDLKFVFRSSNAQDRLCTKTFCVSW